MLIILFIPVLIALVCLKLKWWIPTVITFTLSALYFGFGYLTMDTSPLGPIILIWPLIFAVLTAVFWVLLRGLKKLLTRKKG